MLSEQEVSCSMSDAALQLQICHKAKISCVIFMKQLRITDRLPRNSLLPHMVQHVRDKEIGC